MAVTRPLTLDEFLLRAEEPALEYARGVVTQKMSPQPKHGKLALVLGMRFEVHGFPPQRVSAYVETRITWPAEGVSYVPDVIAYAAEREPTDDHGDIESHFMEPPDVAVEIHSPGQSVDDLLDRCRWYVQHGVKAALLVHPVRQAVWVIRGGAETGPRTGNAMVDLGDVFEGFVVSVADLFGVLHRRSV